MSSQNCSSGIGGDSSILFVHGADEAVKNLTPVVMGAVSAVYTAESGTEALELLGREHPTLVIASLDLGDMDGFAFCNRVQECSPGAVVLLIGSERGETVYRKAMEAGAARYILLEDARLMLEQAIMACGKRIGARQRQLGGLKCFERHSLALQHLPAPLLLLDPKGEVVFANSAFWRLADYQGALEVGSLALLLGNLAPLSPASGWDCLLEAAGSGDDWSGELYCRKIGGDTVWLQVTLCSLPAVQDEPGRYRLVLMRDSSREQALQKRLELQLRSAFDLLESGNRQEDTLNGMLITLAQLAAGGLTSRQDQDAQALIRQIHILVAAEHEQHHLASLLARGARPQPRPFSLRSAVTALQAAFFEQCKKLNKILKFNVPDYVPDLYQGDNTAATALLASLLGNALLCCDGEDVSVAVDLKERTGKGVLLQFSLGFRFTGAPANSFADMADFLTALQQGREKGEQTGLHLAINLTELLGGKIWVKSDAGKGRTFCCTLWAAESALPAQAIPETSALGSATQFRGEKVPDIAAPPAAAENLRVLLADDNEIDQLAILTLLERCGHLVTCVSNGREAVDEFDCAPYDVVLMDILMPEMDGFEAVRLIREKERITGSHTPVYALTSYSLKAVQDKCIAVGMDGHLSKPVSAGELAKLLAGLSSVPDAAVKEEKPDGPAVLELHDTLQNLGGDAELYGEIAAMFREKAPAVHAELLEALRAGNAADVERLAHKLKGMSSNVGGARYAEITRQIQDNALNDIPGSSSDWTETLERELQELMQALADSDGKILQ